MKRYIIMLMTIFLLLIFVNTANAKEDIKVKIDDKDIRFDVMPKIINSRTLVPVRKIFEEMGLRVEWQQETKTVIGEGKYIKIKLPINKNEAYINGEKIDIDVPAKIIDRRTLVPLRFISESLGADVKWIKENRTVAITRPKEDIYVGITREKFILSLINIMGWTDKKNGDDFEEYVEAGQAHGLNINENKNKNMYITKKEARLLLIRSLGYDEVKEKINILHNNNYMSKLDSSKNEDELIKDMLIKIYSPINQLNGFYAINSYSQKELIEKFNSISYGWSSIVFNKEGEAVLTTDKYFNGKNQDYYLPIGYEEVLEGNDNIKRNLMIYGNEDNQLNGEGILSKILKNKEKSNEIVSQIYNKVMNLNGHEFDGVVIDFERLKSKEYREEFVYFLKELKMKLENKNLYVMVPPSKYYEGYDYRSIGDIADRVIIMAHDYYSRDIVNSKFNNMLDEFKKIKSPLAPLVNEEINNFDVYEALEEISDEVTGVRNKNKISLQISFDAVQFRRKESDEEYISFEKPTMKMISERILKETKNDKFEIEYDKITESPHFLYYDNENNIYNNIWYEDSRSVLSKINLSKLFGINNFSVWRLGNIPDSNKEFYLDIFKTIYKYEDLS